MPPWSEWSVAGVAVPLPAKRSRERETVETGRWQRTFTCNVSTSAAGRVWDGWAAKLGMRTIATAGPHDLGLSRVYEAGNVSVSINFCRMPGDPAQIVVHVERPSDLPRTEIEGGVLIAHGLTIPLPPAAEPGAHDDLTDVGGEDCHDVRTSGLDLDAVRAMYLEWASGARLTLDDRIEGPGLCSLSFRRPEGGHISVSCTLDAHGTAHLRFAFRSADDGDEA